jgi:hypothetical protein
MLGLFFLLALADAGTTQWLLGHGGVEANPVMSWLYQAGINWFWIAKIGFSLFVIVMLEVAYLHRRIAGFRFIAAVVFFQWLVCLNNLYAVSRAIR